MKKYNVYAFLIYAAGLGGAFSTGPALASSGYTTDSDGSVVTSGFGECVQTGSWSPELNTPECDPALAARLEAERLAAAEAEARRSAELAAMEQRPVPKPTLIRLSGKHNVMFGFNSADLTPAAIRELEGVLSKTGEFETIEGIEIIGRTDSSGPETYNKVLSEKRAASVKQFLVSRGVSEMLITSRGEGESNPLADNSTSEGRAKNRRVDILITGDTAE